MSEKRVLEVELELQPELLKAKQTSGVIRVPATTSAVATTFTFALFVLQKYIRIEAVEIERMYVRLRLRHRLSNFSTTKIQIK